VNGRYRPGHHQHAKVLGRSVALAIAVALILPLPAFSASPQSELASAQRRANEAARQLAQAQTDVARADDAAARLQARVDQLGTRLTAARDQLRILAIRRYVEGPRAINRLLGLAHADELVRSQQYFHVVASGADDALERYRGERSNLRDQLAVVEHERKIGALAGDKLRDQQAKAVAEVDRLGRLEQNLAKKAEDQLRLTNQPAGTGSVPAGKAAPPPLSGARGLAPSESPPAAGAGGWTCPVASPHAFSNDYGDPRPGGRSHQGNDILAPRGTSVLANVDGVVLRHPNGLGGLAYFLDGADGTSYYGAHLDSYGAEGHVTAGTVIGTVGDSGDAKGGPTHLHFEIHPGGGGPVNPYPTLTKYC